MATREQGRGQFSLNGAGPISNKFNTIDPGYVCGECMTSDYYEINLVDRFKDLLIKSKDTG